MTESPIVLSVVFEAVVGRELELSSMLSAMVEPTRTEPGCLAYELNTSTEKPGTFLFYEKFVHQKALDEHLAASYVKNFGKQRETSDPVAKVIVMRWTTLQ